MNDWALNIVCCPSCGGELYLRNACHVNKNVESGTLVCSNCSKLYPIVDYVPRFAHMENYSKNFGFQWNKFAKTQLDSYSGHSISRERFFRTTGWKPEDMQGKCVLDVGCGAGRFAEIALSTGANVVALDYSHAVDACWKNLKQYSNLVVIQGDIYSMPFKPGSFDFVHCLGVLQHTPNVRKAFIALPGHVKKGGKLVVDVYPKLFLNVLWPKYWLRPFAKRIPQKSLFRIVEVMVRYLLPISLAIGRVPLIGRKLRYLIPVANYEGTYPFSKEQLKEWAIMDTFDMLSPKYDQPQSLETLAGWFKSSNLQNIDIFRAGFFVGRAVKEDSSEYSSLD